MLGDANVGKTSIFKKILYDQNTRIPNIQTTPYFLDKMTVHSAHGSRIVQVFDTAG